MVVVFLDGAWVVAHAKGFEVTFVDGVRVAYAKGIEGNFSCPNSKWEFLMR